MGAAGIRIECNKNFGYKWTKKNLIQFKGYIVYPYPDGKIYHGDSAVSLFERSHSFSEFKELLAHADGSFSVVVKNEECVWAAVDIARSMPLYYSTDGTIVSDNAETIRERLLLEKNAANPIRLLELYETGFVAGESTAYKNIKQLDIGQALSISETGIVIDTYFVHTAAMQPRSREEAKEKLQSISDRMIKRFIDRINGRPVVLSLSGGYDSRYIACLLKRHGVEDVSCYTYGKKKSFEVIQSQKVAQALGYRWTCVEYTDACIKAILTEENQPYFDMSNQHDFTVYLQNYAAVKELHMTGWFPQNAVFLTGLCHDMPSGQYILEPEPIEKYSHDIYGVAEYIADIRFVRYPITQEAKNIFLREIPETIRARGLAVSDYQSFVGAVDAVVTGYDHSRRFLPMNASHAYFGYEWLLPCWDKELLQFWYSLPYEMRVKQNLYEEWLTTEHCSAYGLGEKKTIAAHAKTARGAKIKRIIGGMLARVTYPLEIPLKRNEDVNNFAVMEVMLYKRLKEKRGIEYRRAALTPLLTMYILEQRYGKDWFRKIECFLKKTNLNKL